jgi:XRE family transcriptional regulator, regulator of sulfur utilization
MQDDIGHRLKLLRVERGLTLRQVQELCGVAKDTVGYLERGEHRPHASTLWKLAKAYGVPASDLMGPAPDRQPRRTRGVVEVA